MKRAALISVTDRSGLIELVSSLNRAGYVCLATSGTRAYLQENGQACESIEEYTGQKEILDGRVKTLHPKIHAGILAKRENRSHMKELEENNILPIDVAVVNLYQFKKRLQEGGKTKPEMVESIDIGGPTMIRAAAKNFKYVTAVIDPSDYPEIIKELGDAGKCSEETNQKLACKVFTTIADYDLSIARYLSEQVTQKVNSSDESRELPDVNGVVLTKKQSLRYGENPHQKAAFYTNIDYTPSWKQLQGKELSYNNLLDFDASLRLIHEWKNNEPTVVIIKHLNPCGVATGSSLLEALVKAKKCDPRSHFGGILAFNSKVDEEVAQSVREDFAEVVLAPEFSDTAKEVLGKNKNLRVITFEWDKGFSQEIKYAAEGYLIQGRDVGSDSSNAELVTNRQISSSEKKDLALAWKAMAHVKSNAITLVKDGMLIGVGAGQMSRIDSVELAIHKANYHNHDVNGAVAASDAFFPFPDSVEALAKAGVRVIISPAGAKRDNEVVAKANELGISLLFASHRHFRH